MSAEMLFAISDPTSDASANCSYDPVKPWHSTRVVPPVPCSNHARSTPLTGNERDASVGVMRLSSPSGPRDEVTDGLGRSG